MAPMTREKADVFWRKVVAGAGGERAGYRLYERGGWTRVGEIPNHALMPDGTPCPATCFYKVVG